MGDRPACRLPSVHEAQWANQPFQIVNFVFSHDGPFLVWRGEGGETLLLRLSAVLIKGVSSLSQAKQSVPPLLYSLSPPYTHGPDVLLSVRALPPPPARPHTFRHPLFESRPFPLVLGAGGQGRLLHRAWGRARAEAPEGEPRPGAQARGTPRVLPAAHNRRHRPPAQHRAPPQRRRRRGQRPEPEPECHDRPPVLRGGPGRRGRGRWGPAAHRAQGFGGRPGERRRARGQGGGRGPGQHPHRGPQQRHGGGPGGRGRGRSDQEHAEEEEEGGKAGAGTAAGLQRRGRRKGGHERRRAGHAPGRTDPVRAHTTPLVYRGGGGSGVKNVGTPKVWCPVLGTNLQDPVKKMVVILVSISGVWTPKIPKKLV